MEIPGQLLTRNHMKGNFHTSDPLVIDWKRDDRYIGHCISNEARIPDIV